MHNQKILSYALLLLVLFNCFAPVSVTYAAPADGIVKSLTSSTTPALDNGGGGGLFGQLFSLLFDKFLAPILNIFNKSAPVVTVPPVKLPDTSGSPSVPNTDTGSLSGKVIVIDPGHGGSNPGAVGNETREADNNLAVSLKLRDLLAQDGAKVVMTRSSDKTVAPEGSSLGQELQARLDIADRNNADIFVSVHTNSNSNADITGVSTYYPSGRSADLAAAIEQSVIKTTDANDKGTLSATFYVLRNSSIPSALVEMGFITNPGEAASLASDSYRGKVARGIYSGIVEYFRHN